ncbi:glycosyltransferase family 2 protein [Mycobacterium decipiens]|uniref:Glycosyltransferase n=1 Tax=Mycobacterium decipiens TaxID=1430326 RepID=A0A1X2LRP5_9MYCO|nr:glycosyltransferase family 2 protein [Mycobacterium decipiens]OSC39383.1 glycosyltransferase [Mycobacterium decipiens]
MPAAPLFSIVIPTFNVASTLRSCLDSITGQTHRDFELVMVDGGSTDRTPDIANRYAPSLGKRLVIHCGPDEGPYDAMNHGVRLASGTWVLFLGADDTLYEPDVLGQVASFIAEHQPSDLVYGDVIMRSKRSRYAGAFDVDRLLFEQNICHQAIFYRRELFASIGPYNLRYRLWADWDFNIRCFSNPALVTRYMDIVVANYNDTSGLSMKEDEEFKKRLPRFVGASALEVCRRKLPGRRNVVAGRSGGS